MCFKLALLALISLAVACVATDAAYADPGRDSISTAAVGHSCYARCNPGPRLRRWYLEVEGAAVWQSRNDVQSPGTTGTRFALDELTGAGPFPGGRVQLDFQAWRRHGFRLIVAPLQITATGVLDQPVDFEGETFGAGVRTEGTYRFNSYRLGYMFTLCRSRIWTVRIGATAKIRDAMVELTQGATTARKTDLGFVPLLHLDAEVRLAPRWRLVADVDGLAGGPGRAIDFALKLRYRLTPCTDLALGYRTIEGGADVDEVYSFAWLHQAVVSVGFRF